eukprot:GHVS01077875.1.p2 GENE.GHVS01077875.1~~GHVS01077875.1.p2  ORF type:complete len:243 (+),score=48.95 GHVS01077875.1:203-931(+)
MTCTVPISVDITHSKYADRRWPQIRLDASASVDETKQRLHHHVGTSPGLMQLYARGGDGDWLALSRVEWTLREYGVKTGWELYVEDEGLGGVCDEERLLLDKSTKVTMTEAEYDKRPNTMRKFLATFKEPGKISDVDKSSGAERADKQKVAFGLEEAQRRFPIGSRCSVGPGDRRGNVSFVGRRRTEEVWLGICLDEPLGSTDGTEGGVSVFDCDGPKYGEWARPEFVEIGDFPPVNLLDEI